MQVRAGAPACVALHHVVGNLRIASLLATPASGRSGGGMHQHISGGGGVSSAAVSASRLSALRNTAGGAKLSCADHTAAPEMSG
jgi:hypothetical protein